MFAYSDPTGTGALAQNGALEVYRALVDAQYQSFNKLKNSSFTLLEAFDEAAPGTQISEVPITWPAFPKTAAATAAQIDADRLRHQDEYVEWHAERDAEGVLRRVTFTTEFIEYFEALARVSADALKAEIINLYPGAAPTNGELFGPGLDPDAQGPVARGERFRAALASNPWNTGASRILCLTQRFNTMGALFNLVGQCGVVQRQLPSNAICANVGGACGPGRNSDPAVCTATQDLARVDFVVSLQDPVGITFETLRGAWTLGGAVIDINDPTANQGVWTVVRNGRRAILEIPDGLLLNEQSITSGAMVSEQVIVAARAIGAPNVALPIRAQTGKEELRGMV